MGFCLIVSSEFTRQSAPNKHSFSPWITSNEFLWQPFLTWLHPTRIHQHSKAVPPPPDAWRFIIEGFYEDYTDNYNSKALSCISKQKRLLSFCFSWGCKEWSAHYQPCKDRLPWKAEEKWMYDHCCNDSLVYLQLALSLDSSNANLFIISDTSSSPQLANGISGSKVTLNQRYQYKEKGSTKSQITRAPSPQVRRCTSLDDSTMICFIQTRTIQGTVRGNTLPVFKQWLKVATSQGLIV